MTALSTIVLIISNIFITIAWNGHLKFMFAGRA